MTTITEHIQILEIASDVWASLLGMTLDELPVPMASGAHDAHSSTATVHITGSAHVSVVLSCSTRLAQLVAATMFDMDESELADDEVVDAFGEIANIVAGNIKSLLPEPSALSLPTVTQGAGHVVTIPGARLLEYVDLVCAGERLSIALWGGRPGRDTINHAEHGRRSR
jgi:chemotaxis protein CheX